MNDLSIPTCVRQGKSPFCKNHKGGRFLQRHSLICEKGRVLYKVWLAVDLRERMRLLHQEVMDATEESHQSTVQWHWEQMREKGYEELVRELYGEKRT